MKDPEIALSFQKVYDDLNELINSVNQGTTSDEKTITGGKAGDIRFVKHGSGSYYFEGKTDEGWVRSIEKIDLDITTLTDNSGGEPSNTIPEQTASYDEEDVANALASLAAKVNEVINNIEKINFGMVYGDKRLNL